ncbi:MAG: hypothetical protein WC406_06215 [Methanoregula sp.]
MTRGRPPQKALDEALPIAQARGALLLFTDEPAFDCDYLFSLRPTGSASSGSSGPVISGAHPGRWRRSAVKRSNSSAILRLLLLSRARSGSGPRTASYGSSGSKTPVSWSWTETGRFSPLPDQTNMP